MSTQSKLGPKSSKGRGRGTEKVSSSYQLPISYSPFSSVSSVPSVLKDLDLFPVAIQVQLRLEVPDARPPLRRWLGPQLIRLATLEGVHEGHVGIIVVDDHRMSELHKRYKNVRGTTD